jgi:L-serine dehydratase
MSSFHHISELIALAENDHIPMHEIVIQHEIHDNQVPREAVIAKMQQNWQVMQEAIEDGRSRSDKSCSGLTGGDAHRLYAYRRQSVLGDAAINCAASAIAVSERNAAMGRIVACPTAGSCGIVPAVLYTVWQTRQASITEDAIVLSLFTAAGIGMVIDQNASIAGATGGCQAECGSAAAMAAAAACELMDGNPAAIGNAAALALKNLLGLVCDPVAGLVEIPCVKRNGFAAVHALLAADMAAAGITSMIPPDEVIAAMQNIGNALPDSLKETAQGGLAVTPTGQKATERIYGHHSKDVL